jgi:hypothetical protein
LKSLTNELRRFVEYHFDLDMLRFRKLHHVIVISKLNYVTSPFLWPGHFYCARDELWVLHKVAIFWSSRI